LDSRIQVVITIPVRKIDKAYCIATSSHIRNIREVTVDNAPEMAQTSKLAILPVAVEKLFHAGTSGNQIALG
jgi:hypothetical protein